MPQQGVGLATRPPTQSLEFFRRRLGVAEHPLATPLASPLIAALCFHQMFEGMGLGGCILQAEYKTIMKTIMVFFFSTTTPFGIALGIGLSKVYKENSPTALITVGLLNASSAGLLIYMALVDLLAADFMGLKLQGIEALNFKAYAAVAWRWVGNLLIKKKMIVYAWYVLRSGVVDRLVSHVRRTSRLELRHFDK
nr:probable zinc transporter 10 [Tanacetum cinerariifolium]